MDTALNPNQTSPRQVLLDRADEELAHAHEQLTRAGEEMARAEEQLSKLEQDAARKAARRKRSWLGGRAARGFTGLVLAACIFAAAMVSQSSYGDTARQIVARWAPRLVATASLPLESSGLPAQLNPRVAQANAAQTALPQPAPPPQSSPKDVAPTAASVSPELTQLLQSMARDLATVEQGIEELKTRQEQMARDNANAVEQLKASQDQMARVVARAFEAKASEAKASGQNVRPNISAPPPRQTATSTRGPVPARPSPHATTQP
jgi:peptidoglycan hydrolase CwlO-like protein